MSHFDGHTRHSILNCVFFEHLNSALTAVAKTRYGLLFKIRICGFVGFDITLLQMSFDVLCKIILEDLYIIRIGSGGVIL